MEQIYGTCCSLSGLISWPPTLAMPVVTVFEVRAAGSEIDGGLLPGRGGEYQTMRTALASGFRLG